MNGWGRRVRSALYSLACVAAIGTATAAWAATPAVAYEGIVYCEKWVETGKCSVGGGTWTIAKNKGENLSGYGICIDVYTYNEHSPYNCAEGKNYALEEPYTYTWAAQVWNWHHVYSEIWGWVYACKTYC